jgi:non-ribosomal peptide synthase protein (TIGR01720 family)
VAVSLSAEETQALLREVPQAYNTQINDALLTALTQAFSRWVGRGTLVVDLEGHGREPLSEEADLSRTIGWFTTIFPVYLDLDKISDPGSALKTIKEQLRRVPNHGIGYGLLRYWGREDTRGKLASLPQAQVGFNYLGRFDQQPGEDDGGLFKLSSGSVGPMQSPRSRRAHLLDISSYVTNEGLTVNWIYSAAIHRRGTIEWLAQEYIEALRAIIAHCQSPEAGGYTPSDFALASLDEGDLSRLARILEQVE